MARRTFTIAGQTWEVAPSGRVTQYLRDEFSLSFRSRHGGSDQVRVVRYAPLGSRQSEESLAELTDAELRQLFGYSQPAWTAPETGYLR